MSAFDQLLELQQLDTLLVQMRHRLEHLPEAADVQRLDGDIAKSGGQLRAAEAEFAALAKEMADAETRTKELRAKVSRLNAQLKTVIAPREAEALQHEIANLADEMSQLDDAALAALERSESVDADITSVRDVLAELSTGRDAAMQVLRAAGAALQAELAEVSSKREEVSAKIDGSVLADYDKRRVAHAGTAIAKLVKATCGGCHIDLSTTEIEALKRSSEVDRECPNCARWLVL